jgi:hypothetical protein
MPRGADAGRQAQTAVTFDHHQARVRLQAQALDAAQSPPRANCVDSTAALARACMAWRQAEHLKTHKDSICTVFSAYFRRNLGWRSNKYGSKQLLIL